MSLNEWRLATLEVKNSLTVVNFLHSAEILKMKFDFLLPYYSIYIKQGWSFF